MHKENKSDDIYFAATLGRKNYGQLELKSGSHEIIIWTKNIVIVHFYSF